MITGLLLMDVPKRAISARGPIRRCGASARALQFVAATPPVRSLMLLLGLVSLMGMPYSTLMPVFADRILARRARRAWPSDGNVRRGSADRGVGAGRRSAACAALGDGWRGRRRAFGASLILFSLSRAFWLSAVLLVPVGCSMMVQMASSNTLIQSMVPDHLRGRVMSIYSMMFMGMAPFGALMAGALAHRLGAPLTVALGGVACLIGAAVFGVQLPAFRTAAREIILALQPAGGRTVDGNQRLPHGQRTRELALLCVRRSSIPNSLLRLPQPPRPALLSPRR